MRYTFTVPLENEEQVGNDMADDPDEDGFTVAHKGMVEMSVLMRPTNEPSGCRRTWRKWLVAPLLLSLAGLLWFTTVNPRSQRDVASPPAAQQHAPIDGEPSGVCVDLPTAWGPGNTPGGGVWKNSKGQGCQAARCGHPEETAWGVMADAACCKCGGGRLVDGQQRAPVAVRVDGNSSVCVDLPTAWGPGNTPGGGVWENSKKQGCHAARCGHPEAAWGVTADAACCKCGGGKLIAPSDPMFNHGRANVCTEATYSAMEEACTRSQVSSTLARVGPYSCNPRCTGLLRSIITNCLVPVERWPANSAFADYLNLTKSLDPDGQDAKLNSDQKTITFDIFDVVQVRHNTSLYDEHPRILHSADAPADCPGPYRCFQLGALDEIYVLFDTQPLSEMPYEIRAADVRLSAFLRGTEELQEIQLAYEEADITLSKCGVEPIEDLVALRDGPRVAKHKAHAPDFPSMFRYCSPVCAEASVFGPSTFDTSYFPNMLEGEVNRGTMGLRLTSNSRVPLNYANLRLEVTVTKAPRNWESQAGKGNPGRVVNAYLSAACLMHDSLDGASNLAVTRLVRGEEPVPGTGCPGAWAGMSSGQLKNLAQTKCEHLSAVSGVPISWPACCEGGPGDTCTEPPPRSGTDELCGACPPITQSSLNDQGRWFDEQPRRSSYKCYAVTNATDPCQVSLDDMRNYCSTALASAQNGRAALVLTESWKCFASIARALSLAKSCAGRDGRKGTAGMRYPAVEELSTALGVFTDGGVLVAVEKTQNETSSDDKLKSCWDNIGALTGDMRSPPESAGWASMGAHG